MLNPGKIGNPIPYDPRPSSISAEPACYIVNLEIMHKTAAGASQAFVSNAPSPGIEAIMRSELVYQAGLKIENRFLLAATAMRAARKLHVSSTRTEDTVNRVFTEVA